MLWTILATIAATVLVVVIAMNFATPEKKLERKIEHRHAVADPQFRREMGVMLGPMILPGNQVRDLQNGQEIFPAMLDAIASARETVAFETYIYWSGEIGTRFAEALAERARAGVEVRVLVDWAGSIKMQHELLEGMQRAGVELHRYHPPHWYSLGRMNNRTHRKLLIVDGRVGFTGGVGIADQWQGRAQSPDHWRDLHFRVEGPAVAQMQAAFMDNWIKATGEVLHGAGYFPPLEPAGDADAHVFISSPAGGAESMHLMYLLSIAAAAHSIDLQASYFVPDRLVIRALLAARARGVRVRVLLPGPHIDSELVRISSKRLWGELLRAGVEIYEYQPTMLHNKLMVVDREMVSVGSTNFDIRSFRLNDEASLNLYDRAFAERMTAVFEHDLQSGRPYTHEMWQRRPWRERFAERVLLPIRSQL
jgi:cardiolipin synthase A/B